MCIQIRGRRNMRGTPGREPYIPNQIPKNSLPNMEQYVPFKRIMLTAEGQLFICPLINRGYILQQRVILALNGIFLSQKRVLQDMICGPSAVNKCPFKRTYYSIISKECLVFGNVMCCPFRMHCLAPDTVPMGPIFHIYLIKMVKIIKFRSNYDVCWALNTITSSLGFCWALNASSTSFCQALNTNSIGFCWTLEPNKNLCYQHLEPSKTHATNIQSPINI